MPRGMPRKFLEGPQNPPKVAPSEFECYWNDSWGDRCVGGHDYGQTKFKDVEKVYPQCRKRANYQTSRGPLCGTHLNIFARYRWITYEERNQLVIERANILSLTQRREIYFRSDEEKALVQAQIVG